MKVYILMGHEPVGAYLDRGLASCDDLAHDRGRSAMTRNPIDDDAVSVINMYQT